MNTPNRTRAIGTAKSIIDKHNVVRPPVRIDKLARKLGAKLLYAPLDDELSGMVYIKDGDPIIGVNALHHPNRQRFTIAHEVGHLLLHKDQIAKEVHVDKAFLMLRRDAKAASGTDNIEIEANAFAAEILMPEKLVLNFLEGDSFDIDDEELIKTLAQKFKVSTQAMQFRLGNFIG